MPILKNAKKALRVSKRKAKLNQPIRSKMKTSIDAAKKKSSLETIANAFSAIDKAVKRNVIHRKKAARLKSQVSRGATAQATKPASKAKVAKKKAAK